MDGEAEELDYDHSEPGDITKDNDASEEAISTPDRDEREEGEELEEGEVKGEEGTLKGGVYIGRVTDDDSDDDVGAEKKGLSPIRVETPPLQFSGAHPKPSPVTSPSDNASHSSMPRCRPEGVGLCKFYLRGHCTWGDGCKFLHPPGAQGSRALPHPGMRHPYPQHDMPSPGQLHPMHMEPRPRMRPHLDHMPPRYPERDITMMRPIMSHPPRWAHPPMHRLPPPPMPPDLTAESAWERGLKEAKEMLRKAQAERGEPVSDALQEGQTAVPPRRVSMEDTIVVRTDMPVAHNPPVHETPTFERVYHTQRSVPIQQTVYQPREKVVYIKREPPLVQRAPPVHDLLPRTPEPEGSPSPNLIKHLALERISPSPPPQDSNRRSPRHIPRHGYEHSKTLEELDRKGVLPPPPSRPNHNHPPPKIYKGTSQGPLQRMGSDAEIRDRPKQYGYKPREEHIVRRERAGRDYPPEPIPLHVPPVHHLSSRDRRDSGRDGPARGLARQRRDSDRRRRSRERDEGRPLPYDRPRKRNDGSWKDPWDRRRDRKKHTKRNNSSASSNSSRSGSSSARSSRTPRARAVSLTSSDSGSRSRSPKSTTAKTSSRDSSLSRGKRRRSERALTKSVADKAEAKALQREPSPGDLFIKKSFEALSSSDSSPSPEREVVKDRIKEEFPSPSPSPQQSKDKSGSPSPPRKTKSKSPAAIKVEKEASSPPTKKIKEEKEKEASPTPVKKKKKEEKEKESSPPVKKKIKEEKEKESSPPVKKKIKEEKEKESSPPVKKKIKEEKEKQSSPPPPIKKKKKVTAAPPPIKETNKMTPTSPPVKETKKKVEKKKSAEKEKVELTEDVRKPFKMSMIAKNHVLLATGCAMKDEEAEPAAPPPAANRPPPSKGKPDAKKKTKELRKEELLKQLKAVESAIAKKRTGAVPAV